MTNTIKGWDGSQELHSVVILHSYLPRQLNDRRFPDTSKGNIACFLYILLKLKNKQTNI